MRLWPQVFFGVRSADRVRLSDHPRAQNTHAAFYAARARGDPVSEPKRPSDLNAGQNSLPKPPCKQFRLRTQQPAPAGVSQFCGTAIPNTGSGAGHDTLQHTTLVKSPEYTRTFCAVRKSLVSLSLCLRERASRGLNVPLAPALRSLF